MNPILISQLQALAEDPVPKVSILSNSLALIYEQDVHISWCGLYYVNDNCSAWLGPFQGKPACIKIPQGKGVIGACISQNQPVLVEDVLSFPGHIACDSASRSEIVLPLYQNEQIKAVLDLDSDVPAFFSKADQDILEQACRILEKSAFCIQI